MESKPPHPTPTLGELNGCFVPLTSVRSGVSLQGVRRTVVTVRQHIKQLHPRRQQAAHQLCTGANAG